MTSCKGRPSDKCRHAVYVLRSGAWIGNGCQTNGWLGHWKRGNRKQKSSYGAPPRIMMSNYVFQFVKRSVNLSRLITMAHLILHPEMRILAVKFRSVMGSNIQSKSPFRYQPEGPLRGMLTRDAMCMIQGKERLWSSRSMYCNALVSTWRLHVLSEHCCRGISVKFAKQCTKIDRQVRYQLLAVSSMICHYIACRQVVGSGASLLRNKTEFQSIILTQSNPPCIRPDDRLITITTVHGEESPALPTYADYTISTSQSCIVGIRDLVILKIHFCLLMDVYQHAMFGSFFATAIMSQSEYNHWQSIGIKPCRNMMAPSSIANELRFCQRVHNPAWDLYGVEGGGLVELGRQPWHPTNSEFDFDST